MTVRGKNTENEANVGFPSTARYKLQREIGRGGMGIVWLAEKDCEGVKDLVVLKTLKTVSDEHIQQLKREANIATGLRHENIVKTYGLESITVDALPESFQKELEGLEVVRSHAPRARRTTTRGRRRPPASSPRMRKVGNDPRLYLISMDFIEGTDLGNLHREHIRRQLLIPVPLCAFIIARMCRALAYAHNWIVHRDISPENILINAQGVCKLSDFGIAVEGDEEVTLLAGKLGYMAPEQLEMEPLDHRADIFGLGVVAYQILTGLHLYRVDHRKGIHEQITDLQKLHQTDVIPPHLIRDDIPKILSRIVMKMLASDPNERYDKIVTAGNDLEQKYMYADGFGPTNNSLESYVQIFTSDFKEYSNAQLRQLRFLEEDGKIVLKRRMKTRHYTEEGVKLFSRHGLRLP